MALTSTISGARQTRHPKNTKIQNRRDAGINHAVRLIHAICGLAGSASLIDEMRAELRAEKVRAAIRSRDTGPVFDWLMSALSYQGISDQVAYDYMERHGRVTWRQIKQGLDRGATCPKLKSYWHFHGCRYDKVSRTCAEPDHIRRCPLPKHHLRNGRLNQTAYCLFLFIRDVADADFVGWIDRQLKTADGPRSPDRLARMRASLIEPLRQVYGVSDKVLTMALSCILLGAPKRMEHWIEVGGSMIAIDTLVHNFLHIAPASWLGSMRTTCTGWLATSPAAARTLFKLWQNGSTPGSSIRHIRRSFPGSSSTQSGGTVARAA
jgi:hypothetical protein